MSDPEAKKAHEASSARSSKATDDERWAEDEALEATGATTARRDSSESEPLSPIEDPRLRSQHLWLRKGVQRRGMAIGIGLFVPGCTLAIRLLSTGGLEPLLTWSELFFTVLTFAGLPSLVVFAGLARNLVRHADAAPRLLLRRAVLLSMPAGLPLGVLAAVPAGALAEHPVRWLPLAFATAAWSSVCGAVLALWLRDRVAREEEAAVTRADSKRPESAD